MIGPHLTLGPFGGDQRASVVDDVMLSGVGWMTAS